MHDLTDMFPGSEDELKKLSLLKPVAVLQDSASTANPLHPYHNPELSVLQSEQEVVIVHDTCEISAIYMQRHKHQSSLSLGHWFVIAHGLQDNELRDSITALCAKRIIVRKGYNRLSLHTLERFNSGEF